MPNVFARVYSAPNTPVDGVHVYLAMPRGQVLNHGVSAEDGLVFLGEHAAGTYEIRVCDRLVKRNSGNTLAAVLPAVPAESVFQCPVASRTLPQMEGDRLCLCTGEFLLPSGKPGIPTGRLRYLIGLDRGRTLPPRTQHGAGVITSGPVTFKPSAFFEGWSQVELLRNSVYTYVGDSGELQHVYVPDNPTANLVDVLSPTAIRVVYYKKLLGDYTQLDLDEPTITMQVGTVVEVHARVLLDSGAIVDSLDDTHFESSNVAVALLSRIATVGLYGKLSAFTLAGLSVGVSDVSNAVPWAVPGVAGLGSLADLPALHVVVVE